MKKILFSVIAFLMFMPSFVKADGGIMPPPDHWMLETGQKAAIVFQNKTETLVLQTSFQGDAEDFAYIVPTPSQPEVTKISDDIFSNLLELTMPQGGNGIVPMAAPGMLGAETASKDVTVVEKKKVGIYDVKVLTATDANALYKWLQDNNFTYPAAKKYILDDYIQNKWYFTTAKITTEAVTQDVATKLKRGELSPLKLVFATDVIVYPMKISGVVEDQSKMPKDFYILEGQQNSGGTSAAAPGTAVPLPDSAESKTVSSEIYPYPGNNISISLYIFAEKKQDIPDFYVSYANSIKAKDIEKLAKDDTGKPWVDVKGSKMFLTKLDGSMTPDKMTKDIFPDNAKDNKIVGVPSWWERNISWLLGFVLLLAIMFYVLIIWQVKPLSRTPRIILWVIQILSSVIVGLPLVVLGFIFSFSSSGSFYYDNSSVIYMFILLFWIFSLPLSMIVIMLLEKNIQKRLENK